MSQRAAKDPSICEIHVENVQPKDFGKWKYEFERRIKI